MVPDIDYPNKQAELLQFEEQLKSVAHVTLVPRSWLRELTDWVASTSGLDANVSGACRLSTALCATV